jgi:hypothetical protein
MLATGHLMIYWSIGTIILKKRFYNTTLMKKQNKCERNFCTTQRKPVATIRRKANFSAGRRNANVTPP